MGERGEALSVCERETEAVEIIFMFLGFTFGADSISEEVMRFSPLWFPRGKLFMPLVSCVLMMCMLFSQLKILRS